MGESDRFSGDEVTMDWGRVRFAGTGADEDGAMGFGRGRPGNRRGTGCGTSADCSEGV